jgi:hypothetical protein
MSKPQIPNPLNYTYRDKIFTNDAALRQHRSRQHKEHVKVTLEEEEKIHSPSCENKFKLRKTMLRHQRESCKGKVISNEESRASTASHS